MVYVMAKGGTSLMPTKRHGNVRRLLNSKQAKVIRAKPFTVQLLYETTAYTQECTLGVDSGFENIGLSVVTEKEEIFSAEVALLRSVSKRIKDRSMYRIQRRSRRRHRKPRFDNRRRKKGWLAPSITKPINNFYWCYVRS